MSTRPVSSPSAAHWKFVLGAILFFAVGMTAFILGGWPPDAVTLLVCMLCLALSVAMVMAPHLLEFEARVRLAEAQARDHIETQIRRLVQTTEQLGNAISRSQSTEEQAGQALGTLEELTEKLNAQADELAQNLARSHERELTSLKDDVARLLRERDERLATLDQRLDAATVQLAENQLATKKSGAASSKALEEIKERMIALAARLDELAQSARTAATATPSPVATIASSVDASSATAIAPITPIVTTPPAESATSAPPFATIEPPAASKETTPPSARAETPAAAIRTGNGAGTHESTPTAVAASAPTTTAAVAHSPKPRARRAPEAAVNATAPAPTAAPARISAKPQMLDLPMLDLPESRPIGRRDHNAGASTLVATAYIGIGNKLYVRGDGPGLTWEHGVPMQFLAIGKWGWTSPEADAPITCRIYRNDDTPMLDENITIAPGAKAEITPRF